ncbi:hypothetical protein SEA_PUPPER_27 [Gordonia phage Pupper]|uniref:Uncharacterized protein n=1 Tax=Gordonia phage Pupper TaxID=2571249 RepID=A0A4Y6ETA4_9CAUD|nr:hypothetical protein KHQ83_gp027 [Gordonia phage Pupper]QDF18514.1 hypothetical protein SEA_PUPPER_27 [Gordonia phage Pupper]QDF18747.1 hypothetical protein SEA_SCENTAE_27 [Gordonia phage SCentae]
MTREGEILDMGAAEPMNVLGVESMVWASDMEGHIDLDGDPDIRLHFSRTRHGEWKTYIGGKTYLQWEEVLRRFGPVRVTAVASEVA